MADIWNNNDYWKAVANEESQYATPANQKAQSQPVQSYASVAANPSFTDAQRYEARTKAAAAQQGQPATQPQAQPTTYRSSDGRISYDQYGRQLDSLGHVAIGTWGGGSGGGGAVPGAPAVPASYGLVDPNTGLPLRPPNYAFGSGMSQFNPIGADMSFNIPFADGSQDPVPWAGLNDAQIQRAAAYYNLQLPQQQLAQNAYQYANDFTEAKRRYDQEFPWTKKRDAYSVAGAAYLPNARFLAA